MSSAEVTAGTTCARLLGILQPLVGQAGPVGPDTELADAGLSSLAAVRLMLEIETEFGTEMPLSGLLECRTPRDLADRIDRAGRSGRDGGENGENGDEAVGAVGPVDVVAAPASRYEPVPATPMQEAYVVGRYPELDPDAFGCHHYHEFAVDGLDADRLSRAWQRVVEHFDALRLTGVGRNQRVQESVRAPGPVVHETADADALETEAGAVRRRLSHHRYPPGHWPPFQVEICREPAGRAVVHLSLDGTVTDAHGTDLLLHHWWQAYDDDGHRLPEVPFSLRDTLDALARHRDSAVHRAALSRAAERLKDLPGGPALLLAEPPPPPPGLDGHLRTPRRARLTPAQWTRLRARAAGLRVSPTSLVLTAFTEALTPAGSDDPFTLVLTTTDRPRLPAAAEGLVGPYTSGCLLVVDAHTPALSPQDAARTTHQRVWEALSHAAVGSVEVLRELRAHGTEAPALPVVFTSLLDLTFDGAGRGSLTDHERYAVGQTSGIALDHQMRERDGGLDFRWDTADALFPPGTPDALFGRFCRLLQGLCEPAPDTAPPPRELQQAYLVARLDGHTGRGCQYHQSFHVDDLDLGRLRDTWRELVTAHEALRLRTGSDGTLGVLPAAPVDAWIPVVDVPEGADAEAVDRAVRADMTHRPFGLGRGAHTDLRVVRAPGRPATVHLAVDLLVGDARSIVLLARDLLRRYADPDGAPPVPTRLPRAPRPVSEAARAHWRDRLAGLPAGPPLRDAQGPSHPRRREHLLTDRTALTAWADRHGVSLDATLLAAYCTVLGARYDEPFALPVVCFTGRDAQRPAEFTELTWTRSPEPGADLAGLARACHRQLTADLERGGGAGLAEMRSLVMRRRKDEDFAHPVVFTTVLDVRDRPLPAGVRSGPAGTATTDVALDCVTVDDGAALHLAWDALDERFPDGVLDRAFAHYVDLLTATAAERGTDADGARGGPPPSGATADAAGPAERDRLLYAFNDTARPYPAEGPVHLLFERQARSNPDAVALRWREGTMTYGELNRRANLVAHRLRQAGVGEGASVGISVRRGPAMAVSVFAVLKAGGAYVPVDPSLPDDRAHGMLRDTRTGHLLVTAGGPGWQAPDGILVHDLDAPGITGAHLPDPGDPESVTGPDSVAYRLFTSGSTGRPKCVVVAHRSLHNLFDWCHRTFDFGPRDTGLCVTSLGFDLSVFDILGLLAYGAGLYVADEAEQRDPELLTEALLREPVTFWNSAPTTLARLAPLLREHRGHPGAGDLRLVFLSGDWIPVSLPDDVRGVFGGARVISLGGATEATVWSNWYPVGVVDPEWRSIPYGRPIDNARYYVLDERREPCPVGVEGDLYIAGDCLSLGYHGQPELTRERFVPEPFAGGPESRMYATGDRAAFRGDGVMVFLGRRDHQVKIRGFRVELGEIEHRLRAHPAVHDAVVVARPDGSGDRRLVAYLLAEPGVARPSVAELRAHAARTLPDYMVPNFVAFLPSFPATGNGKLDRDALPWPLPAPGEPEPPTTEAHGEASAERPTERPGTGPGSPFPPAARLGEEIGSLLAELIGVPGLDPTLDLWDQGATSFTLAQLSSALRARYGRRVPVSALLAEPTVAGMARHLAGGGDRAGAAPEPTTEVPAAQEERPPEPAAPDAPVPPDSVEFFSAEDRDRFKSQAWHLRRRSGDEPLLVLDGPLPSAERYRERATRRDFADGPLAHDGFLRFLAALRSRPAGDGPRRLYPSAGDTYAVQVYLHVKPGAVEGVPGGLYYHRPDDHALQRVAVEPGIDRTVHFSYNRPVFDRAAFEVYLISEPRGVEPLYGEESELYLAVEAGYMGQLLMSGQQESGVGLCAVGGLAFDRVRGALRLHPGQRLLHAFLAGPLPQEPPARVRPVRERQAAAEPRATARPAPADVAVMGAAGRYPGADGLEEFWENLRSGRRTLGPLPAERLAAFAAAGAAADRARTWPHGGYLRGDDGFDGRLFRISPQEAEGLDPQLRLLLPVVWQCLEDAGHTPGSLVRDGERVGVFTATMWHDHRQAGEARWREGAPARQAGAASDLPARIAHCLGLEGPAVAVDTACSSSLTALHLAVTSLRQGECDAALVTGVNVVAHPYHLALLSDLGLAAERPSAGAFGAEDGGWPPGEGAGALLLRPLRDAVERRDVLHAVVEATGIGAAGRPGPFAMPAAGPLARSLTRMLHRHGLEGADIGYAECAASGALLADAAELDALLTALRPPGSTGDLLVGTVKPHIGHLEAASGLSQLTKVLLQLRERTLAPTAVAPRRTALPDWTRLTVPGTARPWTPVAPGAPLRALVNAVSATGAYGHAVLRSVDGADGAESADGVDR
ncbi:amino acid adenylation domain-containing protein [Streptomyces humidus]|uniref:amino acid adenylation domain-containing protein n=1 Tax=Streptomyces humidus TaxID=52259 RepID=UPI001E2A962A|nr:amino acid adenylation domain-containing protein [Streptomyces humidus]